MTTRKPLTPEAARLLRAGQTIATTPRMNNGNDRRTKVRPITLASIKWLEQKDEDDGGSHER